MGIGDFILEKALETADGTDEHGFGSGPTHTGDTRHRPDRKPPFLPHASVEFVKSVVKMTGFPTLGAGCSEIPVGYGVEAGDLPGRAGSPRTRRLRVNFLPFPTPSQRPAWAARGGQSSNRLLNIGLQIPSRMFPKQVSGTSARSLLGRRLGSPTPPLRGVRHPASGLRRGSPWVVSKLNEDRSQKISLVD